MLGVIALSSGCSGAQHANPSIRKRWKAFSHVQERLVAEDASTKDAVRRVASAYANLFSSIQTPAALARLNGADLRLLYKAAIETQFYTNRAAYVRDAQLDLSALEKKHLASQTQYIQLQQALVMSRMFPQARALARAHPAGSTERFRAGAHFVYLPVAMVNVPEFRDESERGSGQPTALFLQRDGREMVRRTIVLNAPAQVVVVISPGCHFGRNGIGDIEADPELGPAFRKHTLWLTPPMEYDFENVANWNRMHPHVQMAIAYDLRDWPEINRWETPTFYFLMHGKVKAEVVGWPRGGNKPKIRAALKRVGLLGRSSKPRS